MRWLLESADEKGCLRLELEIAVCASVPGFSTPESPHLGKPLFVQVMDFLPWKTFHRIVDRYGGDHRTRSLSCAEQFRVMAFAQLTYRESLRDIEVCLAAQAGKLYHMGIGAAVAGFSLNSLRSRARSACSVSDCELTDTYSPAAIAMAPATSPATPAIKTPFWFAAAALVRGSHTCSVSMERKAGPERY
jgi:hypothetical protein